MAEKFPQFLQDIGRVFTAKDAKDAKMVELPHF
jgi:hypothetical protein